MFLFITVFLFLTIKTNNGYLWPPVFWQQTHQMSLVQTGIKKYPMSTVKYTAGSLMLWACFSARGPENLVQTHGIMDSINTNR